MQVMHCEWYVTYRMYESILQTQLYFNLKSSRLSKQLRINPLRVQCFKTVQFHISMSEAINRLNLNGHVLRQAESIISRSAWRTSRMRILFREIWIFNLLESSDSSQLGPFQIVVILRNLETL